QDPQNLGTLLRTAEAVGVHGVVIPLARTAQVTPAVVNASSGASEHLLIAQANLSQVISTLKEEGLWIIGLEGSAEASTASQIRLDGPLGLVVGSEGEGMRRLVRESCDLLLQLPMRGQIESLNAAVAGSIALYLAMQARNR
ncbi:MAG: 23S rRNA (guanosine(2251)-2'-O)-methyltransferase RlmB, partial [Anaerolineales bacterium]